MKITPSTRRSFIKTAATAVTAFNILPRHVLGGPRFVPPSEKVNVALVGAGGRGLQNMRELLNLADVQVIAVDDPAESFSLEAFYYKGSGGRKTAKREVETHYAAKTPNFRSRSAKGALLSSRKRETWLCWRRSGCRLKCS